jgi:hypothetical protein
MAGNPRTPTENIDEVILGLLNLKSGQKLYYQTYLYEMYIHDKNTSALFTDKHPINKDIEIYNNFKEQYTNESTGHITIFPAELLMTQHT